jgi:Tfp pilus assembly protein FimT
MIVLVGIVGVLAAFSVPAVNDYVRTNRLDSSCDQMAADLNVARTMSITNARVYQFVTTADGYRIIDMSNGSVVRERQFEGDVAHAAMDSANFFPWGMADAAVFDLQSCAGNRTITLLPTGIVEVD